MRLLPFLSILTAAACAGLVSCSDSKTEVLPENVIAHNDLESAEGWAPANPSLTTAKAHSGRYSMRVDNGTEYGVGYGALLAKVSPTRLKKLELSAWVLLTGKETEAKLVIEVKNPADDSQKVFWDAIILGDEVKELNKWTEVKKTFTMPENIAPTHELRFYLWRGGSSQPVFVDDVTLTRAE